MNNKLGRLPRHFKPEVPHMSSLRMMRRAPLPPVPASVHYDSVLPGDLGMMANDRLGDCTSAGCYHARQVWTANTSGVVTEPDSLDVEWYSENSGYDPNTGANDNGAAEQTVLQNWMQTGLPTSQGRKQLLGFVEIDPRNSRDVKRAIYECGLVYIGFDVPGDIPESPGGAVWTNCHGRIEGGHCVICPGFDGDLLDVISWGTRYKMAPDFWSQYVDECYALISADWIKQTGKTLLGMDATELIKQMRALCDS